MSDSSDDMELYSSYLESYDEMKIEIGLENIINCKLSDFNDEKHMINYMKKIARNLLKDLSND